MGVCQSNKTLENSRNKIETQPIICQIDVSKVKPVPDDEKEEFIKTYISDIYIHEGEEEFEERLKDKVNLMFKRWDWLQKNKEVYVNMLREKGFSDESIQDCMDGKKPLCFESRKLHSEFCNDLANLKLDIEKELNLNNVKYVQTGSSVPGFSSNPHKGFADRPSKITNVSTSDVDIVVIAKGIKNLLEAKKNEGSIRLKEYPTVSKSDGTSEMRFGTKDLQIFSKKLSDWKEMWTKKMGGGVQITFQEDGCVIPPWELPIPIKKII